MANFTLKAIARRQAEQNAARKAQIEKMIQQDYIIIVAKAMMTTKEGPKVKRAAPGAAFWLASRNVLNIYQRAACMAIGWNRRPADSSEDGERIDIRRLDFTPQFEGWEVPKALSKFHWYWLGPLYPEMSEEEIEAIVADTKNALRAPKTVLLEALMEELTAPLNAEEGDDEIEEKEDTGDGPRRPKANVRIL